MQGTSIGSFPTGAPFTVPSERWAADTWIKPLSDGSFAVVLVNKDPLQSHVLDIRLRQGEGPLSNHDTREDFYPAGPFRARIRDVATRTDVGVFSEVFNVTVPPQDAKIYRVYPVKTDDAGAGASEAASSGARSPMEGDGAASEKDIAKLAQTFGQLQPFIAVLPQECMGYLADFGPT